MIKNTIVLMLVVLFSMIGATAFSQDKPREQKLPPINELPKKNEVKSFYEFEKAYEYKLYNKKGKLVKEGNSQFVDTSKLPNGTYFFLYNGNKVLYKKGN